MKKLDQFLRSATPGRCCPYCGSGPLAGHSDDCDVKLGKIRLAAPVDVKALPRLRLHKKTQGLKRLAESMRASLERNKRR